MEKKWTEDQALAINTRDCNLLVAAAAGSGKTAVLVERIIKMVTDEENPVDIDKLLVVTFTEAAASEMRERIASALSKKLSENPSSRKLQMQMTLLNKASITTIHAFCLKVIKNNFHRINLDPNFRIGDNTEIQLLKQEAVEELLDEKYEKENLDEGFISLVEGYSPSKDDTVIEEMILNIYSFIMSMPWPQKWLNEVSEEFNINENFKFEETNWAKVIMQSIKIEITGIDDALKNAIDIVKNEDTLEKYLITLNEDYKLVKNLKEAANVSIKELNLAFKNVKFSVMKRCGKDADKEKQEQVKKIRDNIVKKGVNSIKERFFSTDYEEIITQMKGIYPIVKCLCNLVMDFHDKFRGKKVSKGIIDFNDFEHYCLDILTEKDDKGNIIPSEISLELRKKYEEILIDEYQDSNLIQEVIMSMVSKKDTEYPNLFMVGDVKQSIYKFRQAMPELFLEKYNTYSDENSKNRKITLYKNFRSRKEILDATNYIFKQIMSKDLGELEYNDSESLNLGAVYKEKVDSKSILGGKTELCIIEKNIGQDILKNDNEENSDEESLDNIKLEARMIAKRILKFISKDKENRVFKIFDKEINEYRPIEFRDIVILLRATTGWSESFVEELKKFNIPVYADTGSGYFENAEIQTILSLLQIIDNPLQDIPLLSVLRSPIASFTPEELIDIRNANKKAYFYEALKSMKQQCEDKGDKELENLGKKCSDFLNRLDTWRKKAIHVPIDEFIWYLYMDTGFYGYVGAMPGGIQRQANLRILFQRAKQYENTSYKGLFNFITFINRLKISSGDMGSAKILSENENVVRIMSIHKSKGLEFPVVFLAGMGKRFNMRDLTKRVLIHNKLGFGLDYVNYKRRISCPTIFKESIKDKIKIESLSEEMRILYVAFTRAREKLIITATVKDIEESLKKWADNINDSREKISKNTILKGNSFIEWIGPAVIKHKDAKILRELAGTQYNEKNIIEDSSKWNIKIYKKTDIMEKNQDEKEEKVQENAEEKIEKCIENFGESKKSKYFDEISKILEYKYPYKELTRLPAKISVTELKKQKIKEEMVTSESSLFNFKLIKKPRFLEKKEKLTAAEKGTAMHVVMQHLKLKENLEVNDIKSQINEMVFREIITEKQANVVPINKIKEFLHSSLGVRMLNSSNVNREFTFQIKVNPIEIYKELDNKYKDEYIILQGAIDCYFEEDGEIVLIDYKTDYINGNIEEIKSKYEVQVKCYEKAIQKITGKKVKEKYLYMFYNGKLIKM